MEYLKKRISAFKYAFKGVYLLFRHEAHALIHLIAAIGVITAGFLFKISGIEWCVICLCIGGVFTAEGFNTAIEKLGDKITSDQDSFIGAAKDIAAGAVLLMAITSAVIGCIIFIPKL